MLAHEVVQPVLVQKLSGAYPRLETHVALWLLQQIFLIAGPHMRTREVSYATQRRAYGL
jgi:hypothetical protein